MNGAIGQERPMGEAPPAERADHLQQSSPVSQLQPLFAGRGTFEQNNEQTPDSVFASMTEKEKYGMKGYLALAEGTNAPSGV